MTRLAGPIRQIGVVVRDVDAAIRQWCETVGIGPFVVFRHIPIDGYRYRGASGETPDITIAVGHSGPLQVEIIQQHNAAPSGYRNFLDSGREGMQHVSAWHSSAEEYDAAYLRFVDDGLDCVHEGRIGDVRFAYFSRPDSAWPQVEISEALVPSPQNLPQLMERIAAHWTGQPHMIEAQDLPAFLEKVGV